MKKFILLCMLSILCGQAYAQTEIRLPEKPKRSEYKDFSLSESGYWTAVDLSVGSTIRFTESNMIPLGISWVNGYRFNEYIRVGLGVGLKYFFNNKNVRTTSFRMAIPVYLEARGNFISQLDREAVPYWAVDLGGEFKGGFLFSPTIGYRFGGVRNSFTVGVSYVLSQYNTFETSTGERIEKDNNFLNGVAVKLGYEF